MSLKSLKEILDQASVHDYGVPAFNINSVEQGTAIAKAACKTNSPVIFQFTSVARQFLGDALIRHLVKAWDEICGTAPLCVHQDHAFTLEECLSAIDIGFTGVMRDGSLQKDGQTLNDFATNVKVTAEAVGHAHGRNVSVEGALGIVGSLSSCMSTAEDNYAPTGKINPNELTTDPEEAEIFVSATNVDALGIAVGTTHGALKFSKPPNDYSLNFGLIEEIKKKIPNTHLVMHGGSCVPQNLQNMVNEYGGNLEQTWGIPVDLLKRAIRSGIRKINIDTDTRLVQTAYIRKSLAESPGNFDPKYYLTQTMKAVEELAIERFGDFGCIGKGS